MSLCPCQSEKEYEACCGQYHEGKNPETAEKLMRARYSAFCKNKIDFIADSHKPGTVDFNKEEAKQWATTSTWKGLEIVNTKGGEADDKTGIVEFKAKYSDKEDNDIIHHEVSDFVKIEDKWFYSDGKIVGAGPLKRATPKVGRNEPCPCGSGKKFKKCCGKA